MPRVRLNGTELHYDLTGRGAETVVFAHGLFSSGRLFAAQVEALAPRFRCLTFDCRGHGRSEIAAPQSLDTLADDMAALVRCLRLGPVHVVGHSLGGLVGLRFALAYPGLAKSLTLASSTAAADTAWGKLKARWLPWLLERVSLGRLFDLQAPLLFGWRFLRTPAGRELVAECRQSFVAHTPAGIAGFVNAVVERESLLPRLRELRLPVLAVVGASDRVMPPVQSRRIAAAIPKARLAVLPNVGHGVPFEAAAAFNRHLLDFLPAKRLAAVA